MFAGRGPVMGVGRHVRLVLLISIALLAGCRSAAQYPWVSLEEPPLSAAPDSSRNPQPLRVAIAAVISPGGTIRSYSPFLQYLEQQTGQPVELVQRRTYAEVNNLLRDGGVDIALVCTGAYVQGHRDFGMQLLAIPQVKGETVYYSLVIVPAKGPAQSLADLRGKRFAFTDPMSNSGYLMPVYMLLELGEASEDFFGSTTYTYSHDNSIQAVADGLVDGASVDSLVYDFAVARDPTLADRVRVVARSEPCGMPPVVVPNGVGEEKKAGLKELLLSMHQNEAGRAALSELMIDRFITAEDSAYDSVRRVYELVGESQ